MPFKSKKDLFEFLIEGDTPNISPAEYHYGKFGPGIDKYNKENPLQLPGSNYKETPTMSVEKGLPLASDPHTHPKMLSLLAKHPSPEVQKAIAGNPNAHPNDLLLLASKPAFVKHVTSNPAFEILLKMGAFDHNPDSYQNAYRTIMIHADPDIKEMMKTHASNHAKPFYQHLAQEDRSQMLEGWLDNLKKRFVKEPKPIQQGSPTSPTQPNLSKPPTPERRVVSSLPSSMEPKDKTHAQDVISQLQNITGNKPEKTKYAQPKKALATLNTHFPQLSPVYNAVTALDQSRKKK